MTFHKRILSLALWLMCALHASGAIWYAKETGTGTQAGTNAANAIARTAVMAAASAGDTIIYCGALTGSINYTKINLKLFAADINGNTNKNSCTIVGSSGTHAIWGNDGVTGVRIWGFHVLSAYIDGIKPGGDDVQIRDCWVEKAGRGDPSWNTSGSYRGQGIAVHSKKDVIIEFCLVENCGALPGQDHGMYINGTNYLVRCNIVRTNIGWGIQCADVTGDNDNVIIEQNLVHDNGYTGFSQSGIVFQTQTAKTNNKIRNNTVVARTGKYAGISYAANSGSRLTLINNILIGDSGYGIWVVSTGGTNTVISDFNLKSSIISSEPQGANDVAGTPTFDSEASGRYWLGPTSLGRNMASRTECPTTDFFGRAQSSVYDVGFAQFEDMLANDDTRNLGDGARDPWVREGASLTVVPSSTSHEIRWLEPNNQHAFYYLQRKDSVGNSFAVLAALTKGQTFYADPVSGMTNGLTYTYTLTPETSLGNSGGIHSIAASVICDKFSTIHPSRVIAWGTNITGLPNGVIPTASWTAYGISTNIPGTNIVVVADGVTDNAGAIMAALKLLPSNSIVQLPAGSIGIGSTIGMNLQSLTANNNKVLRGYGTNSTFIVPLAGFSGSTILQMGVFNEQGTERTVSTSLARGATQLTLPGGLGAVPIQLGTILKVWENTSSGTFGATSGGGNADPVYNSNDGSTLTEASAPLKRDTVVVTGISGNTLTFDPPLINSYSANARVQYQYLYMANSVGMEGFTVDNTTRQVSRILTWEGTAYSWIKELRFIKANASHIRAQMNTRWMMEGCLVHDAAAFVANAGIGLQMLRDVDSGVIRNNVFSRLYPCVEYQKASDGNFFIANYYLDPQGGLAPVDNHGGHNSFTVHEQEDLYGYILDGYFNGAENWWFYRVNAHGNQSTFGARKVFNFGRMSRRLNVACSVIGFPGTNWQTESFVSGYNNTNAFIIRSGYPNMGNDTHTGVGTTYQITDMGKVDIGVKSNLWWHGNFTHDTNAVSYMAGVTNRVFPYSLFKEWDSATAPSWWTYASWPAIGTDQGVPKTNDIPVKIFQLGLTQGTPTPPQGVPYDEDFMRILQWFFFPIVMPYGLRRN